MKLFSAVAFVFVLGGSLFAQDTTTAAALAKCAAVTGNLERLDCYDKLARSAVTPTQESAKPEAAIGGSGKWQAKVTKNPVDDTQTVVLQLIEDGNQAGLVLRCQSGKPEVYVAWKKYLGSDASAVVTRLGDTPAETKRWSHSTDNKATFYPGNYAAFMRQLTLVDRLVVQVTPYSSSPVTAVFDLRGLSEAIKPLQQTCRIQ